MLNILTKKCTSHWWGSQWHRVGTYSSECKIKSRRLILLSLGQRGKAKTYILISIYKLFHKVHLCYQMYFIFKQSKSPLGWFTHLMVLIFCNERLKKILWKFTFVMFNKLKYEDRLFDFTFLRQRKHCCQVFHFHEYLL